MEFRDLKKQYQVLKPQMDQAMQNVASSGGYIMGEAVALLEQQLQQYVGVKHCITCANGTDALTLALKALGIGKGDAVFVPDFTFFASAEVVALEGATPVFVDVDPSTFNMASESLEQAINQVADDTSLTAKAVIAVDLFGLPADFSRITALAHQHGLYVIEDGAQGFGGRIGDKRSCSFGDIATTSFFPAKPLGCYGDGGAVFTDNDEWAEMIRSLRVHGKGSNKYDNVRIGINSRLDTLQAAILGVKLNAFVEYELESVNKVASRYSELINNSVKEKNVHIDTPMIPDGFLSSWAQYTIKINFADDPHLLRTELQQRLKSVGIPTMVYYPTPMSKQTAFRGLNGFVPTPNAECLSESVLSLPMHPYLLDEDVERVVKAIVQAL